MGERTHNARIRGNRGSGRYIAVVLNGSYYIASRIFYVHTHTQTYIHIHIHIQTHTWCIHRYGFADKKNDIILYIYIKKMHARPTDDVGCGVLLCGRKGFIILIFFPVVGIYIYI